MATLAVGSLLALAWWADRAGGRASRSGDAPATMLAGVRLGESRDDVVRLKGAPHRTSARALEAPDGVAVIFDERDAVAVVVADCARVTGEVLLSIRCGIPIDQLEATLGKPDAIARSADPARHTHAYEARHAAFLVVQGRVSALILYAGGRSGAPDGGVAAR